MKSPFPGMDPYLEQHWYDVHHNLITYARDQIQPRLPSNLLARVEERVFVESEDDLLHVVHPDVYVVEHPQISEGPATASGTAVAEPVVVRVSADPVTQGFIEIIDASSGNRVITVIEFLSPTNKVPGEGQDAYLKKQKEVRASKASLVEIDLTRAGTRVLSCPMAVIPRSHRTTYQVCVRRGWRPFEAEIYAVPLRNELPTIRIPLRQRDPDVPLDLQSLINQCYENGRYDTLNYGAEPVLALDADDARWADELLRSNKLR